MGGCRVFIIMVRGVLGFHNYCSGVSFFHHYDGRVSDYLGGCRILIISVWGVCRFSISLKKDELEKEENKK